MSSQLDFVLAFISRDLRPFSGLEMRSVFLESFRSSTLFLSPAFGQTLVAEVNKGANNLFPLPVAGSFASLTLK